MIKAMKKLLSLLFVLTIVTEIHAQWAVADAPNLAQNVKNYAELQKQVTVLSEQKGLLDESLDLMRKVNTNISNSITVKYILERQIKLSDSCLEIIGKHELSSSTAQTLISSIGQIMSNNSRMITLSRMILSSSVKMNDAERLNALNDIERKMREDEQKIYKLSSLLNNYQSLKNMLK